MRKIIIIAFCLINYVFAQNITYTPMTGAGYQYKYLKADSGLAIPYGDTILSRGTTRPGSMICYTVDNRLYYWNGVYFSLVGTNSSTGSNTNTILISGSVIWDSNFVFHNTALTYQILGRNYSTAYSTITIPGSDTLYDRYTVFYADTSGNVGVINGTVGSPADIPQVDANSQVLLAQYFIPANSTSPSTGVIPITNTNVYKEGIEWILGGTVTGLSPFYSTNPYAGVYSTRVPAVINGQYLDYTNGATVSAADYTFLSFELRLGATFTTGTRLAISFYKDGSAVSNTITITSGSYGFVRTTFGTYQLIALPISAFAFTNSNFNKIHIGLTGSNINGFQLDNVILQTGGAATSGSGVNSYNGRTGNVLPIRADNQWNFDSTALSSDSLTYYFFNNGVAVSTLPTLKRDVVPVYPLETSSSDNTDTVRNNAAWLAKLDTTGTGGGSGSVEYLRDGYGIKIDSSSRVYTVRIDSATLSLKYLRIVDSSLMLLAYRTQIQKNTDSIAAHNTRIISNTTNIAANTASIALKLNITDTVNMRSRLIPGTNITITGTYPNQTITAAGSAQVTSYQTQTASGSTAFTFTSVPSSTNDYIIFVNGSAISPTTDYTTSGNVVTIPTIVTGDVVRFQEIK